MVGKNSYNHAKISDTMLESAMECQLQGKNSSLLQSKKRNFINSVTLYLFIDTWRYKRLLKENSHFVRVLPKFLNNLLLLLIGKEQSGV